MADVEQLMLKQYNLSSLDPWEWPAEKDQSDTSEDEGHAAAKRLTNRRSKARFSALERDLSVRSSVPGSQKNSQGIENLVQDDEPDPLGSGSTVVRMLRQRKLSVDEDLRLRMTYRTLRRSIQALNSFLTREPLPPVLHYFLTDHVHIAGSQHCNYRLIAARP